MADNKDPREILKQVEAAIHTMEQNGTRRSAPGRYRLLKERRKKLQKDVEALEDHEDLRRHDALGLND